MAAVHGMAGQGTSESSGVFHLPSLQRAAAAGGSGTPITLAWAGLVLLSCFLQRSACGLIVKSCASPSPGRAVGDRKHTASTQGSTGPLLLSPQEMREQSWVTPQSSLPHPQASTAACS